MVCEGVDHGAGTAKGGRRGGVVFTPFKVDGGIVEFRTLRHPGSFRKRESNAISCGFGDVTWKRFGGITQIKNKALAGKRHKSGRNTFISEWYP